VELADSDMNSETLIAVWKGWHRLLC